MHLKEILERFELTDGCFLGLTTENTSLNYSMTHKVQSTLEASGIKWPVLRNHIPCMAYVRQLALGAFMSCFGVKGRTRSREAHEYNWPCGENERIDIQKS